MTGSVSWNGVREDVSRKHSGLHVDLTVVYPDGNCKCQKDLTVLLISHRAEHEKLTKQVVDFQRDFRAGKIALSISLMNFLKTWLTEHIMGADKKYSICAS